jgi:hypothetical protein
MESLNPQGFSNFSIRLENKNVLAETQTAWVACSSCFSKFFNGSYSRMATFCALLLALLCVSEASAQAKESAVQSQDSHLETSHTTDTVKTLALTEQWVISPRDVTLRRALARWSTKAEWQLHWDAAVDLPISVTATFDGDFRSAIHQLFTSLSAAEVNLSAVLYTGNHVLRVTENGQRAQ